MGTNESATNKVYKKFSFKLRELEIL